MDLLLTGVIVLLPLFPSQAHYCLVNGGGSEDVSTTRFSLVRGLSRRGCDIVKVYKIGFASL